MPPVPSGSAPGVPRGVDTSAASGWFGVAAFRSSWLNSQYDTTTFLWSCAVSFTPPGTFCLSSFCHPATAETSPALPANSAPWIEPRRLWTDFARSRFGFLGEGTPLVGASDVFESAVSAAYFDVPDSEIVFSTAAMSRSLP